MSTLVVTLWLWIHMYSCTFVNVTLCTFLGNRPLVQLTFLWGVGVSRKKASRKLCGTTDLPIRWRFDYCYLGNDVLHEMIEDNFVKNCFASLICVSWLSGMIQPFLDSPQPCELWWCHLVWKLCSGLVPKAEEIVAIIELWLILMAECRTVVSPVH